MSIINQIADLESQLAALEAQKNELTASGFIDASEMARIQDQANVISNHLAELYDQRGQVEERVQKQEEQLDNLATFVSELGLYRLAKPAPVEGERLTDYTETEKEFNEIVYFGYRDYTKSLQDEFNKQLDAKDKKIAELRLEVSGLKDELKSSFESMSRIANDKARADLENEELHYENNKLLEKLNDNTIALRSLKEEIFQNEGVIDAQDKRVKELTEQLEKKPVAAPQLSGTLQDKIASFKQNNTIKSNLEIVLAGETSFRGKVIIGGDKEQAAETATTFQGPVQDSDQYTATTDFIIEPPVMDFRTTEESAGSGVAEGTSQLAGQVSREEFNELSEEVEALKRKVADLVGYDEVA